MWNRWLTFTSASQSSFQYVSQFSCTPDICFQRLMHYWLYVTLYIPEDGNEQVEQEDVCY